MHPGIFFRLSLFFGIFLLAGHAARMFILFVIGLTGMAIFILLTGITIPTRWKSANQSFKTKKNIPTVIVKGLVLLIGVD
ncbi:hypothetical protein [Peribacillus alkalitolerans]|uniref:hypothetical protein n=1 Tax=Peribacillus alkalitolerans TaxID=1550385 RepID=UPI0013D87208|nr:hypothetical protein [Peribacillus alkalitolerans]